jgi:thioredoxin 1
MPVRQLTSETVNEMLNDRDTVLVDFWAPWCGPCRVFKPVFEAAAERHGDVVFAACNTEEQPELAAAFGIRSIPTVMAFREGVLVYSQPGALPAEAVDELLRQVRALDMVEVHAKAQPAGADARA